MKKPCRYCGKRLHPQGVGPHERFCSKKPTNATKRKYTRRKNVNGQSDQLILMLDRKLGTFKVLQEL